MINQLTTATKYYFTRFALWLEAYSCAVDAYLAKRRGDALAFAEWEARQGEAERKLVTLDLNWSVK